MSYASHKLMQLQNLEAVASNVIACARSELLGREATLSLPGRHKYNGRSGLIDGVMLDYRGRILCLLLIYRTGSKFALNADAGSRTYWPLCNLILDETRGGTK